MYVEHTNRTKIQDKQNKHETTEPPFTLNEIRIYRVDLYDYSPRN